MLASVWLAQGYDSQELRELAGLTRQQGRRFFGSGTIIQPSASELMIMSVSICGLCERKTSLR